MPAPTEGDHRTGKSLGRGARTLTIVTGAVVAFAAVTGVEGHIPFTGGSSSAVPGTITPSTASGEKTYCPPETQPAPTKDATSITSLLQNPSGFFGKGELVIPIKMDQLGSPVQPDKTLAVIEGSGTAEKVKASPNTLTEKIGSQKHTLKIFSDVSTPDGSSMLDLTQSLEEPADGCEEYANLSGSLVKVKDGFALQVDNIASPSDGIAEQTASSFAALTKNSEIPYLSQTTVDISVPSQFFYPDPGPEPLTSTFINDHGQLLEVAAYGGELSDTDVQNTGEQIVYVIRSKKVEDTIFDPNTGRPRPGRVSITGEIDELMPDYANVLDITGATVSR